MGNNYIKQSTTGTSGVSGITTSMAYKFNNAYETSSGRKLAGYRLYKDGKPLGEGYVDNFTSSQYHDANLNGDGNAGDFVCNSEAINKIYFRTVEAAQLIQGTSILYQYVNDTKGLCAGNTGRVNQVNFSKLFGDAIKTSQGLMIGTFKGDRLAYQVTLPGDSSKPWIAGLNSYQSIGVGTKQTIEVNAKIVPESSSSSYIAADTYLDAITATVSY